MLLYYTVQYYTILYYIMLNYTILYWVTGHGRPRETTGANVGQREATRASGRQRGPTGANGRQRGPTGDNDWVTDFGATDPHFFVRIRENKKKNIGDQRETTMGSQILEPGMQILV